MWTQVRSLYIALMLLSAAASFAGTEHEQAITQAPPTDRLWVFHMGVEQLRLHGDRGNDVVGKAGQVGIGMSRFLGDFALVQGFFDIHAGPWEHIRDASFNADFSGSGATIEGVYSPGSAGLRSGSLTWVAILGLSYVDMVGRSIGPNRHENPDPVELKKRYTEQNYQISMNALWIVPGIEYYFMKTPRFTGNTPELLATRVEGYSLRLSVGLPVFATYRARIVTQDYDQRSGNQVQLPPQEIIDKGRLRGYSVITSVHTWLGT